VVSRPVYVFDTGALLAYAARDETVGQILVDAADLGRKVVVPVICLIEAYRTLDHDEHHLLGPLRANRVVDVAGVDVTAKGDAAPMIGAMARQTGRLGAAHTVWSAITAGGEVVTSVAHELTPILGADWPIVEV
jgi:hypothetical protein